VPPGMGMTQREEWGGPDRGGAIEGLYLLFPLEGSVVVRVGLRGDQKGGQKT